MASPGSSSTASYSHAYPPHPQFAGKGLPSQGPPMQAYYPSHHHGHYAHPGPPPDLTERYKLKAKYHKLQKKYFRGIEVRKDLTLELAEKEAKVQQLQDEVDLILDQIHDSDYAHLRPAEDDLFSDDSGSEAEGAGEGEGEDEEDAEMVKAEDGEEGAAAVGGKRGKGRAKGTRKTLDELEDERRRELEEVWGIDGTKQQATLPPPPLETAPSASPAQNPSAALPPIPSAVDPSQLLNHPPPPAPAAAGPAAAAAAASGGGGMKLKLKFGGGGA